MNQKLDSFDSLDDLLNYTYDLIIKNGVDIESKRGKIKEILNFKITLTNPRSRTSGSLDRRLVRSKFAEFSWYLSKKSDKKFITPYISKYNDEDIENEKILGAYGPKIFGDKTRTSQFERAFLQIKERKLTKHAYISISDEKDYKLRTEKNSSPPCTIGLHFIVRSDQLHLTTYMRSNDAYFGLPHDLFCFTMLQELMSVKLQIPLGSYTHVCTSLHVYENQLQNIQSYISEGYHEKIIMPEIKFADDKYLEQIVKAFDIENKDFKNNIDDHFWHDFALFSIRYSLNLQAKKNKWLQKFKTEEFRKIADCSLTK